ncbi:MAG: DUF86 domain-containing protein [Bacteroidota bacterium]
MPQPNRDTIRLRHMLDAARKISKFTSSKSPSDLHSDEKLTLALVRLVEIIGEAASKVSPDVQGRFPAIPWREIIGTRNRLIHGYDQVNLEILWQIVSKDIPPLVQALQEAINKLESGGESRLF